MVIGVSAGAHISEFEEIARTAGAPEGAYSVDVRSPMTEHQATEFLASRLRPLRGGIGFGPPIDGEPRCTVGLIVTWGGIPALMTASHCTQQRWGMDSPAQYLNQPQTTEHVFGPELKDRQGRHCGILDLARCRRADVALYHVSGVDVLTGETTVAHGQIAQPIAFVPGPYGTPGSRIRSPTPLRVVGTLEHPVENDILYRVGWKTGGMVGPVLDTCMDVTVAQNQIWPFDPWATRVVVCQTVAITASDYGDSGGPMFVHLGGDSVLFAGINTGRHDDIPNSSVSSSPRQIRSELFQADFRFYPGEGAPPIATVQISGPTAMRPGNVCMWWATSSIDDPAIEWYAADSLVGVGPLLTFSPASSTTLVAYAIGSGTYATASFSVSVGAQNSPCADQ